MFTKLELHGIEVVVYRGDLNHPQISGNKLHKLMPNIEFAQYRECTGVLSFGGPFSNHLHALAWACKEAGLESIGLVRGELHDQLTPTLNDCLSWSMQLASLSRDDYRACQDILSVLNEPCLLSELSVNHVLESLCALKIPSLEKILVVPEGGSNSLAITSLTEAYSQVFKSIENQNIHVTHAVCATGTGATLAGLYKAAPDSIDVIGVQAVAEGDATLERIEGWLGAKDSSNLIVPRLTVQEGHLGRFAKMPAELMTFVHDFEMQYNIPLDPVYTGKVMFKLSNMIKAGYFNSEDKILFIHTGGLQGKRV